MELMTWTLIIFFKAGYAGGAVAMPSVMTETGCVAAIEALKKNAGYFQSADCVNSVNGKVIHITW